MGKNVILRAIKSQKLLLSSFKKKKKNLLSPLFRPNWTNHKMWAAEEFYSVTVTFFFSFSYVS